MTDQNINQPNTQAAPAPTASEATPVSSQLSIREKLKNIAINLFNKFYARKIIFWPVVGFLGLVFLIIVLGLMFGRKKTAVQEPRVTSTPFILSTPVASPSAGILGTSGEKLIQLKNQIDNLDVKQDRLQPPSVNFDVKF